MRKVKVGIRLDLNGCKIEDEIEVDDEASPEDGVAWWHEDSATKAGGE